MSGFVLMDLGNVENKNDGLDCVIFDGLYFNFPDGYSVPISRCDTPEKILDWTSHLIEKAWFTRKMCKDFISLASSANDLDFRDAA